MKIYARQIAPENQDSYLFEDDGMGPEYINVCGNPQFITRTSALFDRVCESLSNGELHEVLDDLKTGGYYSCFYKNATQAFNELLPPEKPRYTTRDIHALKELVKAFSVCQSRQEDDIVCGVLSVVCGYAWEWRTITGCCQSDWNKVYYPVKDWTKEGLEAFEIMYFNMGSEWIIDDDGEFNPETDGPENISGCAVYCVSYDEEGIKKEIAEAAGGKPEEVTLYKFDRWERCPVYKAV